MRYSPSASSKRETMMRRFALCGALLGATTQAHAHLLASDSFACTGAATQVGQVGGAGWSGAWIADTAENAVFVPAASSLSAAGLPTLGGSLYYDGTLLQPGHALA